MLCITVRSDGMMRIILRRHAHDPDPRVRTNEYPCFREWRGIHNLGGQGWWVLSVRPFDRGCSSNPWTPRLENSSSTGSMILHARATVGFLCPGIETGSAHGDDGGIRIRIRGTTLLYISLPHKNDIDMEQVPSDTYNELVRAVIGHTSLNVHDGAGSNDGIICLSREFPSRFPSSCLQSNPTPI